MNHDSIQSLWKAGKNKDPEMTVTDFDALLNNSTRRTWKDLRNLTRFYLCVMASSLILTGLNLGLYSANITWVITLICASVATLAFMAFGLHVTNTMQRLELPGRPLLDHVKAQSHFFRTQYHVWMVAVAISIWFLGFLVSLYTHHKAGRYDIHVDTFLYVFTAFQISATYVIVRLGHTTVGGRITAALQDVEAQTTSETRRHNQGAKTRVLINLLTLAAGLALLAYIIRHIYGAP